MTKAADQFTRPPLERIYEFHNLIQAGKYPNCSTLARKFEVHLRTVNRDLQFMRDRLMLPLKYDAEHRGFCYTRPVERFPLMPVTESELFALLVAHKAIQQYQGTPFERPLCTAFRKLTQQLDGQAEYPMDNVDEMLSFRPMAPDITDVEDFEILTRALKQKRILTFNYRKLGATETKQRTVHPYHLGCIENHWHLYAFDVARRAMRNFVLTRLSDPEILPGTFTIPKSFRLEKYLEKTFIAFTGEGDYEVVIEFDRWGTDLIRGRKWHSSQVITELPDGCSRLNLHLNSIEEMVGWVLNWGAHAKVIRPVELLNRVRETAQAILDGSSPPTLAGRSMSPDQPELKGI